MARSLLLVAAAAVAAARTGPAVPVGFVAKHNANVNKKWTGECGESECARERSLSVSSPRALASTRLASPPSPPASAASEESAARFQGLTLAQVSKMMGSRRASSPSPHLRCWPPETLLLCAHPFSPSLTPLLLPARTAMPACPTLPARSLDARLALAAQCRVGPGGVVQPAGEL